MARFTLFPAAAAVFILVGCAEDSDPAGDGASTESAASSGSADDSDGGSGGRTDGPMLSPPANYVAFVRGPFIADSIEDQQAVHDAGTMAAQEGAMAAGDFSHRGLVSTSMLGTVQGEYLALDQWLAPIEVAQGFYADPAFLAGIGMLIAEDPSVDVFEPAPSFHSWGSLEAADDSGMIHHKVVVRGRLAGDDADAARQAHDALASAGEEASVAAGDVAHVVFLDPNDPLEFIAVDVWSSPDNLEAVYTDPAFATGFGDLFAEPPSITVFASTNWYEW